MKLELTKQEIETILNILSRASYIEVSVLINKIMSQANEPIKEK